VSCRVVTTREGTPAMLDVEVGEVMHPVGGPGEESRAIYVEPSKLAARLSTPGSEPLVLLDVGLGAASNAMAAWRVSEALADGGRPLMIVSFDNTNEPLELALQAKHAAAFGLDGAAGEAARALLDSGRAVGQRTSWRLVLGELPTSFDGEPVGAADVVFWDLFSPKSNPALWSASTFRALRRLCRDGATLHTYTAATASRAAMLLAGFAVGRGPVTGDRETTIAAVTATDLEQPLGARWLARLARSSVPLPPDAPVSALETIPQLPQFVG
jgi:tRNA U34 5-methylaminomethyl-2-thiouridine-forming methyltransferase MnmC